MHILPGCQLVECFYISLTLILQDNVKERERGREKESKKRASNPVVVVNGSRPSSQIHFLSMLILQGDIIGVRKNVFQPSVTLNFTEYSKESTQRRLHSGRFG